MEINGQFQDPTILKPGKRPLYTWGKVLDETFESGFRSTSWPEDKLVFCWWQKPSIPCPRQSAYRVKFVSVWMLSARNELFWCWRFQFEAASCSKMSFPECYLFRIFDTAVPSLHSYKIISTPQDVTRTVSSVSFLCYQCEFQSFLLGVPYQFKLYARWYPKYRTDAVKIINLAIRPIGLHQPRNSSLLYVGTGPTVSSIFGTLPGSPFVSECQALSAVRPGSPQWYQTGVHYASNSFLEIGRSHTVPNQGSTVGGGMTAISCFARNCWVRTEVWEGALSWWSSQVCSRQSSGRRLRTFSRSRRRTWQSNQ
jgi:hypothetical protein